MASWLLVHPPLPGPAVLGPLAEALRSRGNVVRVPDLRPAVRTAAGWWDRVAATTRGLVAAYDEDAAPARARGWAVAGDGSGRHLDVVTRPEHLADLLG